MKWLPIMLTVLGSLAAVFTPQVQIFISHNPDLSAGIAGILGILLHLLQSPVVPKPPAA